MFRRIACWFRGHRWESSPDIITGDVVDWEDRCSRCGKTRRGYYFNPVVSDHDRNGESGG